MKQTIQSGESGFAIRLPQSPGELIDLLQLRWKWIVGPFLLAVLCSYIATYFVTKQYRSGTVIMMESENVPRDILPETNSQDPADRLWAVQEEVLARARIEKVVERFDPYPELSSASPASVVDLVRSRTAVNIRGSDAFVIAYTDTVPRRAQKMANHIADLFIEEASGARERQVQGASDFIERQLEETRLELETVEESLRAVRRRYKGMLPGQMDTNLQTLQRLQQDRQSVHDELLSAENRRSMLERQSSIQREMSEPESQLVPINPTVTAKTPRSVELARLRTQIAELRERYTEEHPEVVAIRTRMANLEEAGDVPANESTDAETTSQASQNAAPSSFGLYASEMSAWIAAVDQEIAGLKEREGEIDNQIRTYQRRVDMVPQVEDELTIFQRDYDMVKNYYNELLRRKLETQTAEDVEQRWREGQFRILISAPLPEEPFYPNPLMFVGLGSIVGIGCGVGLALLIEIFDHSIKDVRECEALLPYRILVTLPHIPEKTKASRKRPQVALARTRKR